MRAAKLCTGFPTRVATCATFATLFFVRGAAPARCTCVAAAFFGRRGRLGADDFTSPSSVRTDSLMSAFNAATFGADFFAADARGRLCWIGLDA